MKSALLVAAALVVTLGARAAPAGAEVAGGCSGRATFEAGTSARGPFTVDPASLGSSQVLEVPLADTVAWEGSLTGLVPPGSPTDAASLAQLAVALRPIAGEVVVDLPWPLGQMVVGDWNGQADGIANTGEERYELPSLVPRGVVFKVSGEHRENGGVYCSGSVLAKVEGGPFDGPLLPVTLVLTAVAAGLLVWSGVTAKSAVSGSDGGASGAVRP